MESSENTNYKLVLVDLSSLFCFLHRNIRKDPPEFFSSFKDPFNRFSTGLNARE